VTLFPVDPFSCSPDLVLFQAALEQAVARARIGTLLADADFDGEWVHEHVRGYGIRTLIPPARGRPSQQPPAGKWRRRMKRRFNPKKYGQRWQTETVNSMIKRRLGSALRARSYGSQCREIILRVVTHNVMIVIRARVFYRAGQDSFLDTKMMLSPIRVAEYAVMIRARKEF
jgi:hypothetical protein